LFRVGAGQFGEEGRAAKRANWEIVCVCVCKKQTVKDNQY